MKQTKLPKSVTAIMSNSKFLFIILTALTFAACSSASETAKSSSPVTKNNVSQGETAAQNDDKPKIDDLQTNRKVVRNANLTLETSSTNDAQNKITSIVESKGGFVLDTKQTNSGYASNANREVNMTVRVPSANFDAAMTEIRATANRVTNENVSGEDVTDKFVDLEARLKTKKALENQFLELLKTARNVQDTIEVQKQLTEVRGEIERLEGQFKLLQNQISLSTITVTLQTPTTFGSSVSNFFSSLSDVVNYGFSAALYIILGALWFLLAFSPFILIGIALYYWRRSANKKREREKLAQQIAEDEARNNR
ncbi:MAG: DUF4349 domain-containing protein [Pyrinomonadaceae bacterium]|nr:DUF4349 domain-containing protein [Pyrinomonadaceae bacterium]